ncbi:putative gustatory receptor 28a [Armigeres subalbatus]|uniref:putative gustatory receptor 28a n=1 Tax=Armigeres subalbatus TaxID=124917 RepID=UPI002ED5CF16
MSDILKTIPLIWKFPKENIFECMILHYFFLKANGYACFSIDGPIQSGKIRTSILDKIYFMTHLSLGFVLWICVVKFFKAPPNISPLQNIGSRLIWFTCYLSAVLGVLWNFYNRAKVWSLYVGVFRVDQQLLALGANMKYTQFYLLMVGGSAMGSIVLVVLIIGHFAERDFDIIEFLAFSYSNLSLTMLVTIYSVAGNLIIFRLWVLNRIMRRNMVPTRGSKMILVAEKNGIQTIQQYMQIYDQLSDLTETVMIAVAGSFVYLLFYGFEVILNIKRGVPLQEYSLSSGIWSVCYLTNVIVVVTIGSLLSQQGKSTSNLIDQAINSTNNAEIIEMLRLFLMQLGHRTPTLTCGLFPFDWTLVYSILATSTTYLIILIQFENSRSD